MNTPGLFLAGALVTLILVVALALLIYAAVLDGRYADAHPPVAEPLEPVTLEPAPLPGEVALGAVA